MTPYTPRGPTGETITTPDGQQYFIFGNIRIKITEHFPDGGKGIDELITDLVQQKIKEKVSEIA